MRAWESPWTAGGHRGFEGAFLALCSRSDRGQTGRYGMMLGMSETGLGSFEVDVWRVRTLRWNWEVMGTNDDGEPFVMSGTAWTEDGARDAAVQRARVAFGR